MTFLRWAGSKKQLGETLANCWYAAQNAGASGRYIEAFCGSASFFFRIRPLASVLFDVNRPLIECFQAVRASPHELYREISSYPLGETFYYELRKKLPAELSSIQRAARFIYLNRFCFNGLYRTNLSGNFNVPFGAGRRGELPSLDTMLTAAAALANTEFVNGDFGGISEKLLPGDFVYLDPPYAKRNHSLDLQYGPDVFGVDDLIRLFELLKVIDASGAYFVFSYVDCDEISMFAERWGAHKVEVNRTIAADSKKRCKATEVLISNL